MTKAFAQIESTLPHSRKFRKLNPKEKVAYICAHLSPLGGYIGLFRYPKVSWADDADLLPSDLDAAVAKMTDVGLLSYDNDEQFVRIKSWFLKKNAPENASRMASMASDISDVGAPDDMVLVSAAEFTVGSIKRAQRWKQDSTEWGKLRAVFTPFLSRMRQRFGEKFHDALLGQLTTQNRAVKDELCALMPSFQHYNEARCPHPGHTVWAHDTKTRRELDDIETKKDEDFSERTSNESKRTSRQLLEKVNAPESRAIKEGPHQETVEAARRIGAIQ